MRRFGEGITFQFIDKLLTHFAAREKGQRARFMPSLQLTSLQAGALGCKARELLPLFSFYDFRQFISSPRHVFQLFL